MDALDELNAKIARLRERFAAGQGPDNFGDELNALLQERADLVWTRKDQSEEASRFLRRKAE